MNYLIFITFMKNKFQTLLNEQNVTSVEYVFITRSHIALTNFPDYWTNSFMVAILNAFLFKSETVFSKKRKFWKNRNAFIEVYEFIICEKVKFYLFIY